MREIIFDTETTGLDPATGDRVVEIGCVECINHVPTGETFHVYINPERDMPEAAFKVHGLSTDFLKTKPVFAAIAADFVAFIGDADRRHTRFGTQEKPLRAQFARCALCTLWHRQFTPDQTWRVARRRNSGRSLS